MGENGRNDLSAMDTTFGEALELLRRCHNDEKEKLRVENATLRRENEMLRQQLKAFRQNRENALVSVGTKATSEMPRNSQELVKEAQRYIEKTEKRELKEKRVDSSVMLSPRQSSQRRRDITLSPHSRSEPKLRSPSHSRSQSQSRSQTSGRSQSKSRSLSQSRLQRTTVLEGNSGHTAKRELLIDLCSQEESSQEESLQWNSRELDRIVTTKQSDTIKQKSKKRKRASDSKAQHCSGDVVSVVKRQKKRHSDDEDLVKQDVAAILKMTPAQTVRRLSGAQRKERRQELQSRTSNVKVNEVVRDKREREGMQAGDCDICSKFYDFLDCDSAEKANLMQTCSRHRHYHTPPSTPDGHWDIDFPESLQ